MRELSVPRVEVSPGSNALAWSADGELAIATLANVTVFVPTLDGKVRLHRTTTAPIEQWPAADQFPGEPTIYGSGAQRFVSQVAWSPSGMTEMRGCFLAALSSTGDALLFANRGAPAEAVWEIKRVISRSECGPIHSIAWSTKEGDLWGRCRLAVGSEAGVIHFYNAADGRVTDDTYIKLPSMGTIVNMTWSEHGLAVSDDTNHVVLLKNESMAPKDLSEVLPASRFRIGALSWADDRLIVAQTGKVTETSGWKKTCSDSAVTAVAGVVAWGENWSVFGSHGELHTSGPAAASAFPISPGSLSVLGVALHPNSRAVALLCRQKNEISVRYPIPSSEHVRVMFFDLPGARKEPYPALCGSPLAEWGWLKRPGPGDLAPLKVAGGELADALEQLSTSETLDSYRLRLRFGESQLEVEIRRMLAETVLTAFETDRSRQGLGDIDRAVLLSMAHFVGPEFSVPSLGEATIAVNGDFFAEKFDFTAAKDPNTMTSLDGRCWRRCSITLLPLLTQNTLSGGGDFAKLHPIFFTRDSKVAGVLSASIEVCLFTGARWYYRQQLS